MHENAESEIVAMANEIQKLLEDHLLESPEIAGPYIKKADKLRAAINMYGYLVKWEGAIDIKTYKLQIKITVFKPQRNLTPQKQKLYDEWFAKTNNLKPDGD